MVVAFAAIGAKAAARASEARMLLKRAIELFLFEGLKTVTFSTGGRQFIDNARRRLFLHRDHLLERL
jgi:hypothetical protein